MMKMHAITMAMPAQSSAGQTAPRFHGRTVSSSPNTMTSGYLLNGQETNFKTLLLGWLTAPWDFIQNKLEDRRPATPHEQQIAARILKAEEFLQTNLEALFQETLRNPLEVISQKTRLSGTLNRPTKTHTAELELGGKRYQSEVVESIGGMLDKLEMTGPGQEKLVWNSVTGDVSYMAENGETATLKFVDPFLIGNQAMDKPTRERIRKFKKDAYDHLVQKFIKATQTGKSN